MGIALSDSLEILIGAKATGFITELGKASKSSADLAGAEDRRLVASAKATAATDKEAASLAKLTLAQAKAGGGGGLGSAEQTAATAATQKYNVSKAQASLASDKAAASAAKEAAATTSVTEATGAATGAMGALAAVAPAAILAGLTTVVIGGVKSFEELTGQVRQVQAVLGGSAAQASLMVGQFNVLGISTNALDKSFYTLAVNIGSGKDKLADYGIAVAKNKDGSVDLYGTLDNIRKVYQATTDATVRDTIASQLKAKGLQNLLPYLNMTSEQMRSINEATAKSGGIFSSADEARGLALKTTMGELKDSFAGLERGAAQGLIPALISASKDATELLDIVNKIGLSKVFQVANLVSSPFSLGIKLITHNIEELTGSTAKHTGAQLQDNGALGQGAVDTAALAVAATAAKTAIDGITGAVITSYDAKKSLASAEKGVETATDAEAKAQAALGTLLKAGAVDAKAVAAGKATLATASKDLETALDSETKAQDGLTKARQGATALDLADANSKLALSGDAVAKAREAVVTAQAQLNKLEGSGAASADELVGAHNDVKAALDGVTAAQVAQGRAGEALTLVKQKGTSADPAVLAAQQTVADAHDRVAAATDRQRLALADLHTVEAGDPAFAGKVAAARQAVADASDNIATANDAVMAASYRAATAATALNTSLNGQTANLAAANAQLGPYAGYLNTLAGAGGLLGKGGPDTHFGPGSSTDPRAKAPAGAAVNPPANWSPTWGTAGLPGRASGGTVDAGMTYLVGEHQPELLHMGSRGGYISPNAGGGGLTQHITQHVSTTSGATSAQIAGDLAWSLMTLPPHPASRN